MRIARPWPKALALCSTLLLASCYVWWSQDKASARREKEASGETRVLPGSKSYIFSGESAGKDERPNADFISPASEPKKERAMLPSSKIGLVTPPEQQGNEEPRKERTVLPGSKSATFGSRSGLGSINRNNIDDILNSKETEKQEEEPEKKRKVLPGSKSIDRILEPPDLEKKSEP